MHKDVKIGVGVGIVLAVAVVGYILYIGSGPDVNDLLTDKTPPTDQVNVPITRADETAMANKLHESDMPDLIIPRMATPAPTPTATTDAAVININLPAPTTIVPKMEPIPEPTQSSIDEIPVIELVADIPARIPATPQTYVVAAEDTRGYWGIAEKIYGHGKYYELIERANPAVNPSELRPGQKLTLPPLPIKTASNIKTAAGVSISPSAGARVYVVQEGDKLWKIAKKHYGRGDYWFLIDQANPSIRPGSVIRPGQKLIIPPLPNKAIKPAGSSASSTGLSTGRGAYLVKSGDSFWTIAKANYGHGKYEYLIAEANPSVDSRKLMPGQKLTLPPKPAIAKIPARPVSTVGRSTGTQDGRPSFENYKDY